MTIRWKNPRYECYGAAEEKCSGKLAIVSFQREGFSDTGVQGKLRCLECGSDYVVYSAACEDAAGPEDPPLPQWGKPAAQEVVQSVMDMGAAVFPPTTVREAVDEARSMLGAVVAPYGDDCEAHEASDADPHVVEALGAFVRGETEAGGVFGATVDMSGDPPADPTDAELSAAVGVALAEKEKFRARYMNGKLWLPPPFRFVGGKRSSLPVLVPLALRWRELDLPEAATYYEPFIGGGALFWAIAGMDRDLPGWPWTADVAPEDFDESGEPLHAWAVIGDTNEDLVRCYRGLRDDVESVIAFLEEAQENHAVNPEEYYLTVRTMDVPKTETGANYDPLCAARFLYLVGTGFNGVWRTNGDGRHNVPLGRKGKGDKSVPLQVSIDADHLRTCARALAGVRILHADFRETLKTARTGDLVYCDPPYSAVSETAEFGERAGSYGSANGFANAEQQALYVKLCALVDAGVSVIASNADTDVIRSWYGARHGPGRLGFDVQTVQVARRVNSDPTKRGNVGELLITANIPGLAPALPEGTLVVRADNPATTVTTTPTPAPRKKKEMPTEPRPYIVRVTSTLKSGDGQPWSQVLERHSLLQGPRGSGKSRLQQALQWFFTGRLEDVAQRDPKATAELRSLTWAPDGDGGEQSTFYVEVEWSDGTKHRRVLGESTFTGNEARALPMTELLDALRSGSDKARAFFLERLEAGITDQDVLNQIGEANRERYLQVGEGIKHPVLRLLTVIQFCKDRAREIQQESKAAEVLLQAAPVMPPSEARALELEKQFAAYDLQRKAHVYRRVKTARQEITAWESILASFPTPVEATPTVVDTAAQEREEAYQRRLRAFATVIDTCVSKALESCPVCEAAGGLTADHWQFQRAKFMALLEQAAAETAVTFPAEPKITVALANGPREMTRHEVQAQLSTMWSIYRNVTVGVDELGDTELAALPEPTMRYEDIIALQAKVGTDLANERQALNRWSDVLRARETIASAEQRKAAWTSLQGLTEAARDTLLRMQVQQLTERVHRYLPKALGGFGLLLSDGKRETCRIGLFRKVGTAGVVLHTALSGAEEVAVLLALAAALAERSTSPAVLIPRERAFDPKALRETMRALSKSDCQIVLTSTVAPAGRGSKDWAVIETVPLWESATAIEEEEEQGAGVAPNGGPVVATGPAGEAK